MDLDLDPAIFVSDLQDVNKKLICLLIRVLVEGTFIYFFPEMKSNKEVTKQKEAMFFLLVLLDRRIWIRIQSRSWICISD